MNNIRKTIDRPIRWGMGDKYEDCACAKCGKFICTEPVIDEYKNKVKYCSECGNKFDWSEVDEQH